MNVKYIACSDCRGSVGVEFYLESEVPDDLSINKIGTIAVDKYVESVVARAKDDDEDEIDEDEIRDAVLDWADEPIYTLDDHTAVYSVDEEVWLIVLTKDSIFYRLRDGHWIYRAVMAYFDDPDTGL